MWNACFSIQDSVNIDDGFYSVIRFVRDKTVLIFFSKKASANNHHKKYLLILFLQYVGL